MFSSFLELNIKEQFDKLFDDIFIEWEQAWVRKKEYIGTEFYAIEGNMNAWKNSYLNSEITLLIYSYNGKDVGYIGFRKSNNDLLLTELLLKESYRGKGLAKLLFNDFFDYIESHGIKFERVIVETHTSNVANKLYESNGFKLKEIIKNDRENGEDTYIYIKEK